MPRINDVIKAAGLDIKDAETVTKILKESREYGSSVKSGITGISVDGDVEIVAQFVLKKLQETEEDGCSLSSSEESIESYKARLEAEMIQAKEEAEAERIEQENEKEREILRSKCKDFMTTTGDSFVGYRIVKHGGCIAADAVTAVQRKFTNLGNKKGEAVIGNRLAENLPVLRKEALGKLKVEAANLGCNAITGVNYNYLVLDPLENTMLGGNAQYLNFQPYIFCVSASGTAIRIEKCEENSSADFENEEKII